MEETRETLTHPDEIDLPIVHLRELVAAWNHLVHYRGGDSAKPAKDWTKAIERADRAAEWWTNAYEHWLWPPGTRELRQVVVAWVRDRLNHGNEPVRCWSETWQAIRDAEWLVHKVDRTPPPAPARRGPNT